MRALFLVYFLSLWVSRTPFFRFPRAVWGCFQRKSGSTGTARRYYSVYFVLRTCLALHTVYILCCRCVWHYIQCIFRVADMFCITYSVYFVLRTCLTLHTVYISCCGRVWRYIQCIFHLVGRFEGKNGRQRPENEVGESIECRLKGVRRLFEAIVHVAGALFDGRKTVVGAFCLHSCFRRKG